MALVSLGQMPRLEGNMGCLMKGSEICRMIILSIYYPSWQSCQSQIIPCKFQHAPVTHGEHLLDYTSAMIVRYSHLTGSLPSAGIGKARLKLTALPCRIVNELH